MVRAMPRPLGPRKSRVVKVRAAAGAAVPRTPDHFTAPTVKPAMKRSRKKL
ncbi:hypothetical protein AMOR_31150 [Anaeromyxobacter oryzae]|uniref:Uncharacterized protein n=1 Tax=Anaeromyxobacter oryzae TaxID=2918170 RepID=A0ABM7WX77_9BACT|nr:hypothetical protein AMOR_31150 [Anaeromyxobacter oryzae]